VKDVVVRKASAGDVELMLPLLHGLYDEVDHRVPKGLVETVTPVLVADDRGFVALIACPANGDGAVGLITASETTAIYAGGRFASIQEFFVEPSLRSHGIGAALLAELRRIAGQRGWCRLEVTGPVNEETNAKALGFYRSNGFESSGPRLKLDLGSPIVTYRMG
jgi:GNAT superfamily N-acetyltransferase